MHNAAINETAVDASSRLSSECLCSVSIKQNVKQKIHMFMYVQCTAEVMDWWVLQFLSMCRPGTAESPSDVEDNTALWHAEHFMDIKILEWWM